MPPKILTRTDWMKAFSRPLWNGPPLSGKTTGTKTLPRPVHLVVVPGELGHSSVMPEDDYTIHAWEVDHEAPLLKWQELWKELQQRVLEVLTGKHGAVTSLVFDGLHRLYDIIMRVEGWTPALVDDKEGGKQYVKYHALFTNFLSRALASSVPLVGATVYDGLEPIEPGSKITQIFPLLPGRMAKDVMGMFPVVFHTTTEAGRFYWQLKAVGKLQAAGMHVPVEIARKFPEKIEVVFGADGTAKGGWYEITRILDAALNTTKQPEQGVTTNG